jgi:hypothetical protein
MLLAGLGLAGLMSAAALADDAKTTTITGVLIDNACGAKMMAKDDPQAAAAEHPKSCAMKDACAASGYAVISGKRMLKFDENGNKLAKEYLAKDDATTAVSVEGTEQADGTLAVTAINAAPAAK